MAILRSFPQYIANSVLSMVFFVSLTSILLVTWWNLQDSEILAFQLTDCWCQFARATFCSRYGGCRMKDGYQVLLPWVLSFRSSFPALNLMPNQWVNLHHKCSSWQKTFWESRYNDFIIIESDSVTTVFLLSVVSMRRVKAKMDAMVEQNCHYFTLHCLNMGQQPVCLSWIQDDHHFNWPSEATIMTLVAYASQLTDVLVSEDSKDVQTLSMDVYLEVSYNLMKWHYSVLL